MWSKTDGIPWALLAVLGLVALALRVPGLNGGLWADEIYSALYTFRTPFPASLAEFHGDNKHPFYSVLAHAASAVFGEAPWSLRLPAVLFGAATVPVLWLVGDAIAKRGEAWAAASLLAVSYHHVWFSQNARGYALLAFFALLSMWLYLQLRQKPSIGTAIAYAVCAGVAVYTHLTFVFVVLAQFLVALVAAWRGRFRWGTGLVMFGGGALVAVLLYAPMLPRVLDFFLRSKSALRGVSTPGWALAEGLHILRSGLGLGGATPLETVLGGGALLAGALVGAAGVISYWRQDRNVAALLVLPAFTLAIGGFAGRGTMYPRFFFPLAGLLLLVGVRGIFVASDWIASRVGATGRPQLISTPACAAAVLLFALALPRAWNLPKQDYEGAARYAETQRAPGEPIAIVDVTAEIYSRYYQKPWTPLSSERTLDSLRQGRRVWLVYTFPRYLSRFDARLASRVERDCQEAKRFPGSVGGGTVMVCTFQAAPAAEGAL